MNNTIPPEIKKWIKGYADAHDFLRSDINEIIVKALTSLYQHLQENGRVAELEDQLKKSLDLYNNQTETIIKLEKECERLKGLIKQQFVMRRNGTSVSEFAIEGAWRQFKTENNL